MSALRHLLDAARHATAAAVLRASTRAWPAWARPTADETVTALGRQAAVLQGTDDEFPVYLADEVELIPPRGTS